ACRMHGEEVAEIRFHAIRESVIGCVHTAPERIPTTGGKSFGIQNRGKRRGLLKSGIRIPGIRIWPAGTHLFPQPPGPRTRRGGGKNREGVRAAQRLRETRGGVRRPVPTARE